MQKEYISIGKKIRTKLKAHISRLKRLDKQAGASLIEVMVAVAIIVILMSAIGLAVLRNIDSANKAMAGMNIDTMKMAIRSFLLDPAHMGKIPETLEEIASYLEPPRIPKDPWKNDYKYVPADDGTYKLYSMGKDGTDGTEDDIPAPEAETEEEP